MAGGEAARRRSAVGKEVRAKTGPGHAQPQVKVRTVTFMLDEAGSQWREPTEG